MTLFTEETEEKVVEIELSDWTLDFGGGLVFLPTGSGTTSAAPWIDLAADSAVVPANGETTFRFTVRVPETAELAGTYHAMILFATAPEAATPGETSVLTRNRLGLAVYVTVRGTAAPAGQVVDFYQDLDALELIVANDGNTLLRLGGTVELRDESGRAVTTLAFPGGVVLRDSERGFRLPLPADLPPGFYVALALLEDARGGLIAAELPFEVR